MAKVIWRNEALDELDAATSYIRQFDPVAAQDISRKLFDLGESLASFPNRGRPTADGMREMTSVPPYVLTYRVDADEVYVLHVRHGRQRPLG